MAQSIFPGFENRMVLVGDQRISVHVGGSGTPLLLLHGYPQNHNTWMKLAGPLGSRFTCVIADLPGYGASSIPPDAPDHESFSKRRMAALLVSVMASMGFATFSVMGHDRGARVAYRMALDHPATIQRVVTIEIIPTSDMWEAFNAEMAMKAYHWSFLAQPFPLPETLIAGDPVFYLEWTLRSWAKGHRLDAFELASLGKLSRANTRSCTRARNVRRLSRRCVDRQAVRSRRQDARCEDNRTAPFHLVEIGVPSNDRCPPQPMESLDPEPLRRRSRLRALHARRESGRSFGSGSALPERGTLILAEGQTTGPWETEVNPWNQHLRREIFSETETPVAPVSAARSESVSGPRELAIKTWCPNAVSRRVSVPPIWPAPMMTIFIAPNPSAGMRDVSWGWPGVTPAGAVLNCA